MCPWDVRFLAGSPSWRAGLAHPLRGGSVFPLPWATAKTCVGPTRQRRLWRGVQGPWQGCLSAPRWEGQGDNRSQALALPLCDPVQVTSPAAGPVFSSVTSIMARPEGSTVGAWCTMRPPRWPPPCCCASAHISFSLLAPLSLSAIPGALCSSLKSEAVLFLSRTPLWAPVAQSLREPSTAQPPQWKGRKIAFCICLSGCED